MKTLYIIRHAKSSWDFPDISDDQRPLIEKGKNRTRKVLDHLASIDTPCPDCMMSSHAIRALETARIFADTLNYPPDKIIISKKIYHGPAEHLFDQFYGLDDAIETVMIFGHNPTLTAFANFFGNKAIEWIPTSGVVCVNLDTNRWTDMNLCTSRILFYITPKSL
ncbi:MAG: histidine phosphatase family protein [Bacteroidales bacterium]|nr:histidine phosphatase family protein [Bacteroidales bacterium]